MAPHPTTIVARAFQPSLESDEGTLEQGSFDGFDLDVFREPQRTVGMASG